MSMPHRPPLAELHLHLEGCLRPELAWALWRERPAIEAPPIGGLGEDGWHFADLAEFLQLFAWASRLLDTPAAYLRLLQDTAEFLTAQGIVYAELFVAFGVMHYFERDPRVILPPLIEWASAHAASGGVDLRFIADGVRQFGPQAAMRVLDDALELQGPRLVGLGIGGDEDSFPAGDFAAVYERARRAGLGTTLHAGEGTTAAQVAGALDLGVDRVGHGISALQDPRLVKRLVEEDVVLEVCPGSNLRSGAWLGPRAEHPLHELAARGVRVCLGSDDPAFFDTSLVDEWEQCLANGSSERELSNWNLTAARAAFLPPDEREQLTRRLRGWAASDGVC
jgi:adenosine deaminase